MRLSFCDMLLFNHGVDPLVSPLAREAGAFQAPGLPLFAFLDSPMIPRFLLDSAIRLGVEICREAGGPSRRAAPRINDQNDKKQRAAAV